MGKRKHFLRRTSSSSDNDETVKRHESECDANLSVSSSISAAHGVLFEDVLVTDAHVATITMATGSQSDDIAAIKDSLKEVFTSIRKIVSNQEGLIHVLDSKLNKLKLDCTASIDWKINSLRDDLAMSISREGKRIDQVCTTNQSLQSRMETLESGSGRQPASDRDTERTLILFLLTKHQDLTA
ncbi:hypothetical protein DPMN_119608 [Dreissena polymorpha]|uniref:Uncharacterized protein n=1 Tax=Dreissena polymorpha TaxID=45954 RepID=A0A9D4GMB1_DREPO|nr:hypothetical protein DPMN_119608 [Dreissena polymorpha]